MEQGILVPIGDTFVVVRERDRRIAAEQVIDLVLEARRRGLAVAGPNAPQTDPIAPVAVTSQTSQSVVTSPVLDIPPAWRAFLALLESGPAQAYQIRLLHLLREKPGEFRLREDLVRALRLPIDEDKPSRVNNVIGGFVTALIRKARKVGMHDAEIIERSGDGYRAGALVLRHPLPTVEDAPV